MEAEEHLAQAARQISHEELVLLVKWPIGHCPWAMQVPLKYNGKEPLRKQEAQILMAWLHTLQGE